MRRFIIIILAFTAFSVSMTAQTPVESLMSGFDERKGVNVLIAEGGMMTIARGYIRKSPMGPLADSVDEVTILTMKRASDQTKQDFLSKLHKALAGYMYYGKKKGMNDSIVDVYGSEIKTELYPNSSFTTPLITRYSVCAVLIRLKNCRNWMSRISSSVFYRYFKSTLYTYI